MEKSFKSTIIIGDLHINEEAIPELGTIFKEDIFPIRAERIIQVGDFFENHRPTPKEQIFACDLIKQMTILYDEVIILSGNGIHDLLNGSSAIEHFQYLSGSIKVVKGDYVIDDILFGHWMTNVSILEYGTAKHTIKELKEKNYDYIFLGHQHSPQELADSIFHIGSVRWVGWNEVVDEEKHIALLDKNGLKFIPLKHGIPMIDVGSVDEAEMILEENSKCKIRIVYNSFLVYKEEIVLIEQFKKGKPDLKIKLDFGKVTEVEPIIAKQNTNRDKLIQVYLDKIEDKEIREILKEQFDNE